MTDDERPNDERRTTEPYRIQTLARGMGWIAWAERMDDGSRFGIECAASTEAEAVARLTQWLEWQREHTAALAALQEAEHDYHRTIAGSAFAAPAEGPSAVEMQKDGLKAVEAARLRLDDVRARRPE
jgi:acylphosphatase